MDIAALSMSLSSSKVMKGVQISMMKQAMQQEQTQGAAIIDAMKEAIPPSHHKLDVTV